MLKVKKQVSSAQQDKLAELWEDTDRRLAKERIPNQGEWTNPQRQRGTPIHSNEVIRRIRKMNPDIWVEDSKISKERAGFYYFDQIRKCRAFTGAHFQKGMVREHVLVYVDRSDRPTGYELGWREILHRLLKKQLITWGQMVQHFPIYQTALSGPFDRQVQEFKH